MNVHFYFKDHLCLHGHWSSCLKTISSHSQSQIIPAMSRSSESQIAAGPKEKFITDETGIAINVKYYQQSHTLFKYE